MRAEVASATSSVSLAPWVTSPVVTRSMAGRGSPACSAMPPSGASSSQVARPSTAPHANIRFAGINTVEIYPTIPRMRTTAHGTRVEEKTEMRENTENKKTWTLTVLRHGQNGSQEDIEKAEFRFGRWSEELEESPDRHIYW